MADQQGNVPDKYAYVFGQLLGDGCLFAKPSNGDYRVIFTSGDIECLLKIADVIPQGKLRPYTDGRKASELIFYSKDLWSAMSNCTLMKTRVPAYLLSDESSEATKLDVIAGLIDSDGTVKERPVTGKPGQMVYEMAFYNNEWGIVSDFTLLLKQVGIRTSRVRPYTTQSGVTGYDVGVVLHDFAKKGVLYCKRKRERLERYREYMKDHNHRRTPGGTSCDIHAAPILASEL